MKKLLLTFLSIAAVCSLYAQRKVTQERMEQIYEDEERCRSLDYAIRRQQLARKEAAAAAEKKSGRRRRDK